jgi:RimJ/RimL family protein N-acetyltransferase
LPNLNGRHVRLEPLSMDHLDALCAVGLDESLWRWIPKPVRTREDMRAYIGAALAGKVQGRMQPFATIENEHDRVVGSTRYSAIDPDNKRLEIGWTWIAVPWQHTAVNTEAKLLMLRHAFEDLDCNRVEFKTDRLNERSRNAILRLGAKQEGIFRQHIVAASGRVRDTVYFSIIRSEWPRVRQSLEQKLA